MENLAKIHNYRIIVKEILSQYAIYQPSYGQIEIQTLFDTEHDHYQVLGVGWNKKERIYGCSMHLDIKNEKVWIQINNTELDIGKALVEMGIAREDIVIGFQPVYMRQFSGYAVA
jgi:hypothetical protein